MTTYTVIWEIEIDADSPQQAAAIARDIQRDRDSTATVFKVIDYDSHTWAQCLVDTGSPHAD